MNDLLNEIIQEVDEDKKKLYTGISYYNVNLLKGISKETLKTMIKWYPCIFSQSNFEDRLNILKHAFPIEWESIMELQFISYEGIDSLYMNKDDIFYLQFIEVMGMDDCFIKEYVTLLKDTPNKLPWKFKRILEKELGIILDSEFDDMSLEDLLYYESNKWDNLFAIRQIIDEVDVDKTRLLLTLNSNVFNILELLFDHSPSEIVLMLEDYCQNK